MWLLYADDLQTIQDLRDDIIAKIVEYRRIYVKELWNIWSKEWYTAKDPERVTCPILFSIITAILLRFISPSKSNLKFQHPLAAPHPMLL